MHHHDPGGPLGFSAFLVLVANVAIALGYVSVPFFVLRYLRLQPSTLVYGAVFFVGCAGTHLGMGLWPPLSDPGWFWTVWHVVQAVATWMFVIRFWLDLRYARRLLGDSPGVVEQLSKRRCRRAGDPE
jgi:hypothetical protein